MSLLILIATVWLETAEADRPQADPPSFEVASVKLAKLGCQGSGRPIGPGGLTTCGALKHLIMEAYGVEFYQVTGGPGWVQSEFYEVRAKAATASTPLQIKSMLQALLADRFHLRLNRESRTMAGYVLSADTNSSKLPVEKTGMAPESPGRIQMGGGELWARGATMKNVAKGLWLELQSPVIDETKLEGHYDLRIRFDEGNRELADPSDSAATKPSAGSIFTALREIGLKLEARKIPVDVLVIESAERPSDN